MRIALAAQAELRQLDIEVQEIIFDHLEFLLTTADDVAGREPIHRVIISINGRVVMLKLTLDYAVQTQTLVLLDVTP